MPSVTLRPIPSEHVADKWHALLNGLREPAACFGPEVVASRPRLGEWWWAAMHDGEEIGLVWTRRCPDSAVTFGLGLLAAHRGRSLGPALRDAALACCFGDPAVEKVETEVYSSNPASLVGLHERHGRMREEGRQRRTISVGHVFYDRVLLGLTRGEWLAQEAATPAGRENVVRA